MVSAIIFGLCWVSNLCQNPYFQGGRLVLLALSVPIYANQNANDAVNKNCPGGGFINTPGQTREKHLQSQDLTGDILGGNENVRPVPHIRVFGPAQHTNAMWQTRGIGMLAEYLPYTWEAQARSKAWSF